MSSDSSSLPLVASTLSKKDLRRSALVQRATLSKRLRALYARRLVSFASLLLPKKGEIIAGFWPINSEIDPRPLMAHLRAQGCQIALPVIVGRLLQFRCFDREQDLICGLHGIFHPSESAARCIPDRFLVPVCAFDHKGTRIGYGGGYYDRTLAQFPLSHHPTRIGLAFSIQEVPFIKAESHDQPLDSILTEKGLRIFKRNAFELK